MLGGAPILERDRQRGSTLFTTLLILVVMNLLGVGLMQTAAKESKLSMFKVIDSNVFHITDSCVQDTMKWLGDLTTPVDPATLPYVITEADLTHMFDGNETASETNRLNGYSYTCSTNEIAVISVTGDTSGQGEEIGENSGYGAAGDLTPRYFYEVISNGSGPQNSANTIIATVSAEY